VTPHYYKQALDDNAERIETERMSDFPNVKLMRELLVQRSIIKDLYIESLEELQEQLHHNIKQGA
jgi:hypothetical protein